MTTTDPGRSGHALFDTALGRCGIAWRGARLTRFALPEADEARMRDRLDGSEAEPPPFVVAAIADVRALIDGAPVDLSHHPLDLDDCSAFERDIYAAAQAIPPGETRTYGELAEAAGHPGSARATGVALGRNPLAVIVPCHRILAQGGGAGGFSAPGGLDTKFKLLAIENARIGSAPALFDDLPLVRAPR